MCDSNLLPFNTSTRGSRQTIINTFKIKIDDPIGTSINSKIISLREPLILDCITDVYLEHVMTIHSLANTDTVKSEFIVTIDEFNIHSYSNKSHLKNKIIIPNKASTTHTDTVNQLVGEKIYVTTLPPTSLKNLTIKITDSNTTPATMFGSDGFYIMRFVFIPRLN